MATTARALVSPDYLKIKAQEEDETHATNERFLGTNDAEKKKRSARSVTHSKRKAEREKQREFFV